MSSRTTSHIERRRRDASLRPLTRPDGMPLLRRESDMVRARLQHWIELADTALGRRRSSGPAKRRQMVPKSHE